MLFDIGSCKLGHGLMRCRSSLTSSVYLSLSLWLLSGIAGYNLFEWCLVVIWSNYIGLVVVAGYGQAQYWWLGLTYERAWTHLFLFWAKHIKILLEFNYWYPSIVLVKFLFLKNRIKRKRWPHISWRAASSTVQNIEASFLSIMHLYLLNYHHYCLAL